MHKFFRRIKTVLNKKMKTREASKRMGKSAAKTIAALTPEQEALIRSYIKAKSSPHGIELRDALRYKIQSRVLDSSPKLQNMSIARLLELFKKFHGMG